MEKPPTIIFSSGMSVDDFKAWIAQRKIQAFDLAHILDAGTEHGAKAAGYPSRDAGVRQIIAAAYKEISRNILAWEIANPESEVWDLDTTAIERNKKRGGLV